MAKAFSSGQRFRFPNDEFIYTFVSIYFEAGEPVIKYENADCEECEAHGFDLLDLIHA